MKWPPSNILFFTGDPFIIKKWGKNPVFELATFRSIGGITQSVISPTVEPRVVG